MGQSLNRFVFLTALFVACTMCIGGMFLAYAVYFHRLEFQQEVKSGALNESNSLTFTQSEYSKINWIETGKEFEWNGKMYDVASIEFQKGSYLIHCENDLVEDMLIGLLKAPGQKSKNKTPQFQFSKPVEVLEAPSMQLSFQVIINFYCRHWCSVTLTSPSPPPQLS